ncbi:MAG TPA: type II toxin-antitoxin system RelE/ParE family toxin [Pirellulales bacterium]|jgi:hypothetical protein|nr:type II toxin-antitoxin system RelE/ParE family toxin [Pirellulales bacterium]
MPATEVRLFRDAAGEIPLLSWLRHTKTREPEAYKKCLQRILLLEENGNALRRPLADSLGDGVHELRCRLGKVHYRILYGFTGKCVVTLTSGFTKEGDVPQKEIQLAIERLALVKENPTKHTAEFEISDL